MSVAILYTDTDAIRAVTGIKEVEISDSMLTDQQLERQLKTALYGWLPTYATVYSAGVAGGASADEIYRKDLLVSYCLYFGAVRLVEMIMALRQSVGDGKSEVARFNLNWLELLEVFKDRLEEAKALLDELINPSSGGPAYFGKASPDYDPVTNT